MGEVIPLDPKMSLQKILSLEERMDEYLHSLESPDMSPEEQVYFSELQAQVQDLKSRKVDRVINYLKGLEYYIEAQKENIKRNEKLVERLRGVLECACMSMPEKRLDGDVWVAKMEGNGGVMPVEISAPHMIPPELCDLEVRVKAKFSAENLKELNYWRSVFLKRRICGDADMTPAEHTAFEEMVTIVPRKTEIREVIMAGGNVPGAVVYERGEHLAIRVGAKAPFLSQGEILAKESEKKVKKKRKSIDDPVDAPQPSETL